MNDNDPVCGRVDVELDGVRPALECAFKRGKGIFRQFTLGASVSDPLHPSSHDLSLPGFDFATNRRRHLNGLNLEASTSWNA